MQKKLWYGIDGIELIYHNEWNDAEISCGGILVNATNIENTMYDRYKEYLLENDININEYSFELFMFDNKEDVYDLIVNYG